MDSLEELRAELKCFAEERDWRQYHSPKNLTMAICGEMGELSEQFQWLTEEDSRCLPDNKLRAVAEEIADIQLYLILLSDSLGLDLVQEAKRKIAINGEKYPADKARGRSDKYTDL